MHVYPELILSLDTILRESFPASVIPKQVPFPLGALNLNILGKQLHFIGMAGLFYLFFWHVAVDPGRIF